MEQRIARLEGADGPAQDAGPLQSGSRPAASADGGPAVQATDAEALAGCPTAAGEKELAKGREAPADRAAAAASEEDRSAPAEAESLEATAEPHGEEEAEEEAGLGLGAGLRGGEGGPVGQNALFQRLVRAALWPAPRRCSGGDPDRHALRQHLVQGALRGAEHAMDHLGGAATLGPGPALHAAEEPAAAAGCCAEEAAAGCCAERERRLARLEAVADGPARRAPRPAERPAGVGTLAAEGDLLDGAVLCVRGAAEP
ncbi:unnamed protein product [Prorocentrum cordatum]|uniref:Uncharacterized protein n=1 Tax=Prorocentrum cordatum TaxID=2364126 RepID=A0ABN9WZ71_9DINO|nr:unnamed protein product [Polarella glacialis]